MPYSFRIPDRRPGPAKPLGGTCSLVAQRGLPAGEPQKPETSLWHTFRRVWAIERKHLPPNDVAAAGGWLDTGTLQQCYQQCDLDAVRTVVEFERPQARAPGGSQSRVKT